MLEIWVLVEEVVGYHRVRWRRFGTPWLGRVIVVVVIIVIVIFSFLVLVLHICGTFVFAGNSGVMVNVLGAKVVSCAKTKGR
jgi:hypothetical protein